MPKRKSPSVPRKSAKQRRSQETVAAILEAAAQVFQQESYDKSTTDRIAERAGVSIGTLYQYFPDKDAILNVLFERHVEEVFAFLNDLTDHLREKALSLDEVIRRLVRAVAEHQEEDGKLHLAAAQIEAIPPGLAERSRAFHARLRATVKRLMQASPEIRVKNLDCASYLVLVLVDAAIHGFMAHPPADVSLDKLVDHVTGMVLAYLRTPHGE
jgi:AcrR family transcriptional regulator